MKKNATRQLISSLLLLVMFLAISRGTSHAQVLSQTHNAENGRYSFRYPEGAVVDDYGDNIIIDYYGATDDIDDYLSIYINIYNYTDFQISEGHNVLQALRAQMESDDSVASMRDINIGRYAGLRIEYEYGLALIIPDITTQSILIIFGYGDLERYERLMIDMGASVSFGAASPSSNPIAGEPITEPLIEEVPAETVQTYVSENKVEFTLPLDATITEKDFDDFSISLSDDLMINVSVQTPEQIGMDDLLEYVRQEFQPLEQLKDWQEVTLGAYPALSTIPDRDAPYNPNISYFISMDDRMLVIFDVFGDSETQQSIYLPIAESIHFEGEVVAIVPTGNDASGVPLPDNLGLKWQVQRPTGDTGITFGFFNDLDMSEDGLIYIAGGSVGIHIFDPIVGDFNGVVSNPDVTSYSDLVVDADGSFWVVDGLARQVTHMAADGSTLDQWGEVGSNQGQFQMPTQIELDSRGRLYIFDTNTDPYGFQYGHVMVFEQDGTFLFDFKTRVDVREKFESYNGSGVKMTLAPNGNLYIVNRFDAVRVFDTEGDLLQFEIEPSLRNFASSAIAVDTNDTIYIATSTDGIIRKIVPSNPNQGDRFGYKQAELTGGGYSSDFARGEIFAPQGLAVLANGDLVAADSNLGYSQLIRFTFDEPKE